MGNVWNVCDALQTPILLGDEDRARKVELAVVKEEYTEAGPESAPGANFTIPAGLKAAWTRHEALLRKVPSPAVLTPHYLRRRN